MAEVRQKMRGTTAELDAVTSLVGHLVYDTQTHNLRIYDGVTPGGHKILTRAQLALDTAVTAYNATRLNGQIGSFYQDASNLNAGTIADARLPTTMAPKIILNELDITGIAPTLDLNESDTGHYWRLVVDGGIFSVRHDGVWPPVFYTESSGNAVVLGDLFAGGHKVWTAGNDGAGSGLDADLFEGQQGSFYQNASNLNAGLIPDARIPATLNGRVFNNAIWIDSAYDAAVYYRKSGVDRVLAMFDAVTDEYRVHLYNTVGTWVRHFGFRHADGQFYIGGYLACAGALHTGNSILHTDGNLQFEPGGWMASTFGPYLSDALAARVKNDGGTYNINVSGSARYLKAVGGQTLNFDWNGQAGQPTWLWGGNDGSNMYVYNPANFYVYHSQFSGDADKVDGAHLVDIVVPPGAVTHFARNSAPNGWLKANGAAVSRTTYAALFNAIGTTFGAGDGWSTFNLPDMRGVFARSWDDSRGVDTGRGFGTWQDDALQDHRHMYGHPNSTGAGSNTIGSGPNSNQFYSSWATDARLATETRPKNIALLACIKY